MAAVSQADPSGDTERTHRAHPCGQRRHAPAVEGEGVAPAVQAHPDALHAPIKLVAARGRTVLRGSDGRPCSDGQSHECEGSDGFHYEPFGWSRHASPAVPVESEWPGDPREDPLRPRSTCRGPCPSARIATCHVLTLVASPGEPGCFLSGWRVQECPSPGPGPPPARRPVPTTLRPPAVVRPRWPPCSPLQQP